MVSYSCRFPSLAIKFECVGSAYTEAFSKSIGLIHCPLTSFIEMSIVANDHISVDDVVE